MRALNISYFPATYLHQRFDYNPITGVLLWNPVLERSHVADLWNTKHAYQVVGEYDDEGYKRTKFRNPDGLSKSVAVHSIAWKMTQGEDPIGVIDHINFTKDDNRIANLRDVTAFNNSQHRSKDRGDLPVGISMRAGRYRPHFNRRSYETCDTLEEALAVRARVIAERGNT